VSSEVSAGDGVAISSGRLATISGKTPHQHLRPLE
jgi:hypothetical protein